MAVRKWAFIFESPGFTPKGNTIRTTSTACEFIAVGIDTDMRDQLPGIAKSLVDEGVQMIELCGAFGPFWMAMVSEAIGYAIPVGGVLYGPGGRQHMLNINK